MQGSVRLSLGVDSESSMVGRDEVGLIDEAYVGVPDRCLVAEIEHPDLTTCSRCRKLRYAGRIRNKPQPRSS